MIDYKEQLRMILETKTLRVNEDIENIVGPETINEVQNKLFRWQFDKDDAKNLMYIFERFSDKTVNGRTLEALKNDLIQEGKEIEKTGVYPIEVILYTSKVINNRLKDQSIIDTLSEVIGYFITRSTVDASETLEHIIKNWTWVEQLKIAISSLSYANNYKLLALIYDEYRLDKSLKYEVFKTLVNSKNNDCIEMILNMITYIDSDYEADRKIGNFFRNKFSIYYPMEGLARAKELYNSGAKISKFGKKTFENVIDMDEQIADENEFELGKMINVSKKSFFNNKNYFEKAFLNGKKSRYASLVAMRHSREKEDVASFLYDLYTEHKEKVTVEEAMDVAITLALSNSQKSLEICKQYRYDDKFKPYEYACKFLLGDELAAESLAKELITGEFCRENRLTMKAVRACLFKNSLARKIEEQFSKLIANCTERELVSYLINVKDFLRTGKKSPAIIIDLQKICGYKHEDEHAYNVFKKSEKVQKAFMNLMIDLVTLDTINIYEKMMFNIANDKKLNSDTRTKARNIVSQLVDVAEPSM